MPDALSSAIEFIRSKIDGNAKQAVVLGSGLGNFVDQLTSRISIPFHTIPGFPVSTVQGHSGELVYGLLHDIPLWVNAGRVHFYEGYTLEQVVYPIRVLQGLGVQSLILTNAAGSIRKDFPPGDLMLISRLMNLTGRSISQGPESQLNLSEQRIQSCLALARRERIGLKQGCYAGLNGPSYETPAEIRFLRVKGADAVGMSTVHESTAAIQLGMDVTAISCLTNFAAGILDQPLNHQEVVETGIKVQADFSRLLSLLVSDIHAAST